MTFKHPEVWKDVSGYDGLYEVSDLGRMRVPGTDFIFSTGPTSSGCYRRVSLHKAGVRSGRDFHRLIADAFLPPRPSPKHEVRHLDGDKFNNAVWKILHGKSWTHL